MNQETTPTSTRNPHRVPTRGALLPAHPVRPSVAAFGFALMAAGVVFLLQQLGVITTGPVATLALAGVLVAVILGGIALGWARRTSWGADEGSGD